jgi:hypothetical protein
MPGQLFALEVSIELKKSPTMSDCPINFSLSIQADGVSSKPMQISLRCRKWKDSFIVSFRDHDGSVGTAAVIPPTKPCKNFKCPVFLTLHGEFTSNCRAFFD